MDWTQIIIALLTVVGTVTGSVLVYKGQIKQLEASQKASQKEQLGELKKELTSKLDEHRKEYLEGIADVKNSIENTNAKMTDLKSEYQTSIATINLSLSNLTKQVEKHNSVVERTYVVETDVAVLKNRESVSEHRIEDLERKVGDKQ